MIDFLKQTKWKKFRCMQIDTLLQANRRHIIDSMNNFGDYLILRNAHLGYSTLCIVFILSQVIGHSQ